MKYCIYCGALINDNAQVCPKCGEPCFDFELGNIKPEPQKSVEDEKTLEEKHIEEERLKKEEEARLEAEKRAEEEIPGSQDPCQ